MKNKIEVNIKSFLYERGGSEIISDLKFEVQDGDVVVLEGAVGCGKTTLLKLISGIIPNFESGFLDGYIELNGEKVGEGTFKEVGYCFQDSDSQLIFDTVDRQFLQDSKISLKILKKFNLEDLSKKAMRDISRGQRKYITLLSTIMRKRRIYIFDEPLDLLDESKQKLVLEEVEKVSKKAIIFISSHNREVERISTKKLVFKEKADWILEGVEVKTSVESSPYNINLNKQTSQSIVFSCTDLEYSYEDGSRVKSLPSVDIGNREIIGLVGKNGSGKSTYLKLLSGAISPTVGSVRKVAFSRFGLLSQNPNRQLFGNTVYEELFIGSQGPTFNKKVYANYLLERLGLGHYQLMHPAFLSGGQKQKLVFASVLISEPEILFLDEVFTNLDMDSIDIVFRLLSEYRKERDLAIIFTDQSDEFIKDFCDKIFLL